MKKILPIITGVNSIALIVAVNFVLILIGLPKFDITQNKAHSISNATKDLIKKLDDTVNIKMYLSKDLPTEIGPVASNVKSTLNTITKINPNKLTVKYFDPTTDKNALAETQKLGIAPLQFSSIKNDKFEMQSTYFAMVIEYGGKNEQIPIASDVGNLEYMLASSINRITSSELPEVLLATSPEARSQLFNKYLSLSYKVIPIDLSNEKAVFDDKAKSLIIVGASQKIPPKIIGQIQKWTNNEKGLVLFEDKVLVNGDLKATKLEENGLEKLLADNGITVESKLIMDESSTVAQFRTNNGIFQTQYPYWPLIRPENVNNKIPAMTAVNTLSLAWASPLTIDNKAEKLFESSPSTVVTDNWQDITPKNIKISGDKKSYVLGAVAKNKKIAVVGDADFIQDQFASNNQKNLLLALNLVDYVSNDSRLMVIRGKNLDIRPLKNLTVNQKNIVRYSAIGMPIVLLLLIYTLFYVVEKRKKI